MQIQKALDQLQSVVLKEQIYKLPDRAEAQRVWNYPLRALEESLVNSLYHRNWEIREPVEVRILPDCIEIINQGGPDRSVKMDELEKGIVHNRRYRNRRIGDFLKELNMTEGRGTGIPIIRKEMKKNGSPEPNFETDDNYRYFMTRLPIHPAFVLDEGINEGINVRKRVDNERERICTLIREGTNEGTNEGINEGINEGVNDIVEILINVAGLNAVEIAARINKSLATTERYLRILRKKEIIEFKGARRTGGYYFTSRVNDYLNKNIGFVR